MDSYNMIDSIRLKERKGPKPNANSHITFKGGFYGELVRYFIGRKNERDRKLPKDI